MQVNMVFKNEIKHSDGLKSMIEEKTEKFEKYFKGNFKASWTFSSGKEDYTAHLHVVGNHIDFFAEETDGNLIAAVESCVDKLDRQLKKHKEIVKDHHR